jgi:branched-chain amino acid aminotransferase
MVPNGEGVFETVKVLAGRPCLLSRHLERLTRSARELGVDMPDVAQVADEVTAHLQVHPHALGRLRITWAAGPSGPLLSLDSAPTAPPQPAAALTWSSWRIDASSPLSGLKTTNYVDYAAALRSARAQGFDEALLANITGDICEATTANIFYVLDGAIHTPPLSSGCLPGIARSIVLELCEVVEVAAPPAVLAEATEVFVTSSLREVQPVSLIDERRYATAGPKTAEVIAAWREGPTGPM